MTINQKLFAILLMAIILRLFLIFLFSHDPNFSFQQEGYVFYIESLKNGVIKTNEFGIYNQRLFPGYLLLILPFSFISTQIINIGIILNFIIFSLSFILIWKIFKNLIISFIFAFFPPVWLVQTSKASSEPLTIFLLLSALFVFLKKNYLTAGLILGLAFNVRIISGCFLLAACVILFLEKKLNEIGRLVIGFLITSSLLLLYNYIVFGKENLFIQFKNLDENYGVVRVGIIQIFHDIYRTIDWGQYRILFSGSFYLILNLGVLLILFKFRNRDRIIKLCFYWLLFSLIFVFSLSPFTLIENFSRYALPALPTVCLGIYLMIEKLNKKLGFLPKKPKLSPDKKRVKAH